MELNRKHLSYLIICIPVIVFFGLFFYYTVNAPINDDYALLNFINKCISTDSFSEKMDLIFAQHNEHRIVYDRIWTILSYKISGNVNFNFLALLGNLSLIGIALIFFKKFRNLNKEIILFLPITVLIFNISSWENMTFAMATLSNFTAIYFILLSLYFLCLDTFSKKINLFLGILFFLLAVLTQGGGLFLFPLSILIFVYKKEFKNLLIYLVISLPTILLYFLNYTNPGSNLGLMKTVIEYNYKIILFGFAFLGNSGSYFLIYTNTLNQSTYVSIGFGIFLFLLFLYITYKKYYTKNLFIYSVLLLFIISACATSISRVSFGIDAAVASRYRINGIIFLVAIYYWFLETYTVKNFRFRLVLSLSVLYFSFISLKQIEYLDFRQQQTYKGILMYNIGDPNFLNGDKKDAMDHKNYLEESKKLDTYNLPSNEDILAYFPFSYEHYSKTLEEATSNISYSVDTITELNDSYLVDGWAYIGDENTSAQKVYIGLTNSMDNKTIFYSSKGYSRYELNPFFRKSNLSSGGYWARIRKNDIKEGENRISLMVEVNGMTKTVLTDKKIIK